MLFFMVMVCKKYFIYTGKNVIRVAKCVNVSTVQ